MHSAAGDAYFHVYNLLRLQNKEEILLQDAGIVQCQRRTV